MTERLREGTAAMTEMTASLTRWRDLSTVPDAVTRLEVRADLVGDLDPTVLRQAFPGRLLYTLRSRAHGGQCADPPAVRRARLASAALGYDTVDLEADHDLVPDVLAAVPASRRRISWHGPAAPLPALRERFAGMAAVPAAGYLLAPAASSAADALVPLRLLAEQGREDVTAYGTGPFGAWSRVLAPWLGAPTVAGPLDEDGSGALDVARLCADYPLPARPAARALYGLVGPVALGSRFPGLHNRAYREHGIPALYLPFHLTGLGDFLTGFWPAVPEGLRELGLPLRGLSVSGPLKEVALHVADVVSPVARAAGAANALTRRGGRWRAATTDVSAVSAALRWAGVPLAGRRAAVVGCGGAGRAAAVALSDAGAAVTMVNRGRTRGRLAADLLGLPFTPLEGFRPTGPVVVVHATSVHTGLPFPLDGLSAGAAVLDMACPPDGLSALVMAARERGLRTVDGRRVMAVEAAHQFQLMTGRSMPPEPTIREVATHACLCSP
jgi:3-dehydroquinate dehydratase / shikimate dehydrogenase